MGRRFAATIAAVVGLTAVSIPSSTAITQRAARAEPTKIEGAADFRTAPRVTDGDYVDSVVAGDAVWYAVLYTNNVPYEFSASLTDQAPEGTAFTIEFIGPSLEPIGEPDPAKVSGTAYYGSGEETYIWYLKVTLASTGEVGTAYGLTLNVKGATGGRTAPCADLPDCTADDAAEAAKAALDEANAELADIKANGGEDAVRQQIDDGRKQVDQLDKELEPEPTTPIVGVVLLVLIGVAAVVGGFVWSRRRVGSAPKGEAPPPDATTPLDTESSETVTPSTSQTEAEAPSGGGSPQTW